MKKVLFLLIMLFSTLSFSQGVVTAMKSNYNLVSDTAVNSGTAYVDLQVQKVNSYITAQAVVTKISGTVGGNVFLQGSLDGTNFKNVGADTLTNTDQTTNTKIFVLDGNPYLYYRLLLTGSGTMSATIKGYLHSIGNSSKKHANTFLLSQYNKDTDTVTNTATKYLKLQVKNNYGSVVFQPVVTKISGTAAGTITLEGSNDNTNFVTVSTSYSNLRTLSVTDQTTNTALFKVTGSPYSYYRIKYAGSGTMACKIKVYVLPTEEDK